MTRHVALYCRISKDKRGRMEGVDAQESWGREYAAEKWPGLPIKVFKDNNLSGDDATRPGYLALCEAIDRGEVEHLWTVEQSRLARDEMAWFKLAAELDAANITEVHTNRDGIVRVRDEVAGIKAVLAASEKRKMLRRQADTLAKKASEGIPPGGKPFGYAPGKDEKGDRTYVIVDEQRDAIRFAADKILSGWSLSNIAAELRRRGLHGAHRKKVRDAAGEPVMEAGEPVTQPTAINATTVRRMLTNPTVAGLRVHRGQIIGRGNWDPILDEQTWQSVRAKLETPRIVTRVDGGTYPVPAYPGGRPAPRRRYLLTGGLSVCGVCHAPLVAQMKQLTGKSGIVKPYYLCHPKTGGRSCVGIMGDKFEQYVAMMLIDWVNTPGVLDALAADDHAARRDKLVASLAAIDAERNEIAAVLGRGEMTSTEWQHFRKGLTEREQALRAELATVPPPMAVVEPVQVADWDSMTLDERRELLAIHVDRIVVNRAKPGTKGFDPGRVSIKWVRWEQATTLD